MGDRIVRAMVTGASSGLGACFARQLAGRGVEVVLVARDRGGLEELAEQLPAPVEVLAADLTDATQRAVIETRLAARAAPVDLVVNNAGIGGYGPIADQDPVALGQLVTLNVEALVHLSRAALPQLIERGTGGLIQVGSVTASQPNPFAATYGASKAFVRSFTRALQAELAGTGVHALLLEPGTTRTAFFERAGIGEHPMPPAAQMDADEVVGAALRAFALGRPVCAPGAVNQLITRTSPRLPDGLTRALSGVVHRRFRPAT